MAALAAIVEARGRLTEAGGALSPGAGRVRRACSARRSLEVGLNLACLAAVEQRRHRRARARALYARALAIQERVLGRHHADVAMTVNNLAVLERDQGNLDRAAALFRRALDSFDRTLGARHPHTVLALANHRAVEREIAALTARVARAPARRPEPASRNAGGPADDSRTRCTNPSSTSSSAGVRSSQRRDSARPTSGSGTAASRSSRIATAATQAHLAARARSTPRDGCCCPAASTRTSTSTWRGLDPGEPAWVDDYTSGSQAALAGGVTSVGNMSYVLPWETHRRSRARRGDRWSRAQAIADVFFHTVIVTPSAGDRRRGRPAPCAAASRA